MLGLPGTPNPNPNLDPYPKLTAHKGRAYATVGAEAAGNPRLTKSKVTLGPIANPNPYPNPNPNPHPNRVQDLCSCEDTAAQRWWSRYTSTNTEQPEKMYFGSRYEVSREMDLDSKELMKNQLP